MIYSRRIFNPVSLNLSLLKNINNTKSFYWKLALSRSLSGNTFGLSPKQYIRTHVRLSTLIYNLHRRFLAVNVFIRNNSTPPGGHYSCRVKTQHLRVATRTRFQCYGIISYEYSGNWIIRTNQRCIVYSGK